MYRHPETTATQRVTATPQTFTRNESGRGASCGGAH